MADLFDRRRTRDPRAERSEALKDQLSKGHCSVSLHNTAVPNGFRIVNRTYAWARVGVYRGFCPQRVRGHESGHQNGIAHFLEHMAF